MSRYIVFAALLTVVGLLGCGQSDTPPSVPPKAATTPEPAASNENSPTTTATPPATTFQSNDTGTEPARPKSRPSTPGSSVLADDLPKASPADEAPKTTGKALLNAFGRAVVGVVPSLDGVRETVGSPPAPDSKPSQPPK